MPARERTCECTACSIDLDQTGVVGNVCWNCCFYAQMDTLHEGVCSSQELSVTRDSIRLCVRRRGELRHHPLIVGATFGCNFFRPFHEFPSLEDFWRSLLDT